VARKESQEAVKRRLVRALKHVTAEELAELYLVEDCDLNGATVRVLQQRPADALEQGLRLAESPDPERRDAGCWLIALGSRRRGEGDAVLARLLQDPEPSVVHAAVNAYGMLQGGRASHEFGRRIDAQQRDPSLIPWPEPLESFIDVDDLAALMVHEDSWIRMNVAMALLMCGDQQATTMLVQLAEDEDEDVRSGAFHSLGWKAYSGGVTASVLRVLREGTNDRFITARCDAVCALLRLMQEGAADLYSREIRAALERDAGAGAIYPLVNMLYDPLSGCLGDELREEACRRWAKGLVGKGVPRPKFEANLADLPGAS
jgi:HEAT repeat protein